MFVFIGNECVDSLHSNYSSTQVDYSSTDSQIIGFRRPYVAEETLLLLYDRI